MQCQLPTVTPFLQGLTQLRSSWAEAAQKFVINLELIFSLVFIFSCSVLYRLLMKIGLRSVFWACQKNHIFSCSPLFSFPASVLSWFMVIFFSTTHFYRKWSHLDFSTDCFSLLEIFLLEFIVLFFSLRNLNRNLFLVSLRKSWKILCFDSQISTGSTNQLQPTSLFSGVLAVLQVAFSCQNLPGALLWNLLDYLTNFPHIFCLSL